MRIHKVSFTTLALSTRKAALRITNLSFFPRALRARAWSALGQDVSTNALINSGAFLGAATGLSIGQRTFINHNCFFDLAAATKIGANCDIGYDVSFVTSTHHIGSEARRGGTVYAKPIIVEAGVWIGARATILPGVTIGRGCVIAAGSLVTRDCDANGLYAGAPARRKRDL